MAEEISGIFIHHVFFWLADPATDENRKALIAGLKKLSSVKTIMRYSIGIPAETSREVVDSSYSVSWIIIFNNAEDEKSYQIDPLHLQFIEDCKHLWKKVQIFDTIDA